MFKLGIIVLGVLIATLGILGRYAGKLTSKELATYIIIFDVILIVVLSIYIK